MTTGAARKNTAPIGTRTANSFLTASFLELCNLRSSSDANAIEADVVIVGAGPAGSAAAIQLAQLGIPNVVLVDRHDFPRDKTCGSGVSPKGLEILKSLGVWDDVHREAYSIRGLRLITPGNREVIVSGGDATVAIICRRSILDNCLLSRARSLGVRFISGFDAQHLIDDGTRVNGIEARDGRTVRAKYTVVANGAHSRFTPERSDKRTLQGIMGWWENVQFRPNHVEMIFDKALAPHYGWLFPETSARVNIGICYEDPSHTKNARTLFDGFLQKYYQARLTDAVPLATWRGHPISYAYAVGQLQSPGRLVVGEAGRMTHPATGEGIYQGMQSGILAAEILSQVLKNPAAEKRSWLAYEARCRQTFGRSFWSAKIWHRAVTSRALDLAVHVGQTTLMRTALARLMARM